MILTKNICFQNIKIKLNDSAVISSNFPGLRTFAASMTSAASTASVASMTLTASFHQKNTDSDGQIIPGTNMTNTGPFSWNGLSKMQFFTDIWYPFCRRLLRPADVTFLKNSCCTQKFPISAFQNHLQTKSNLHIFIRQSQFIKSISK